MPNRSHLEKKQDLLSSTSIQLQQKMCFGQVVTIVFGQVVATVTKLGRLVPMVKLASCVLTMKEYNLFNHNVNGL